MSVVANRVPWILRPNIWCSYCSENILWFSLFLLNNSDQWKQFLLWAYESVFSSLWIQFYFINICENSLFVMLYARCLQNKDKWGMITTVKEVTTVLGDGVVQQSTEDGCNLQYLITHRIMQTEISKWKFWCSYYLSVPQIEFQSVFFSFLSFFQFARCH